MTNAMIPAVATRPTATNVPATAPELLKKPEPLSAADDEPIPEGLWTIWVTVYTLPAASVEVSCCVSIEGAVVIVWPAESVVVMDNALATVVSAVFDDDDDGEVEVDKPVEVT